MVSDSFSHNQAAIERRAVFMLQGGSYREESCIYVAWRQLQGGELYLCSREAATGRNAVFM